VRAGGWRGLFFKKLFTVCVATITAVKFFYSTCPNREQDMLSATTLRNSA
jgi:hypothetical protein